ncbi:MAG: hypothetical protein ACYS47_03595 [Planctomycetota bacterium]|jgi:hypothetical protein
MHRTLTIATFLTLAGSSLAGTPVHTVRSTHYVLHWQGEEAKAKEMSRLLEAAWVEFGRFFGARPRLRKREQLPVRFFQDRAGWVAGMKEDGANVPRSGGGLYWPPNKTAYLYRQPTQYYTRVLFLHETCHQFHYLSRTGNQAPRANWYIEGVVEHLAWHCWDGENLILGALPVTLKDYPAAALAALKKGKMNLTRLVDGASHRPMGAMLVRFLVQRRKGSLRPRYEKLAKSLDRGRSSASAFKSVMGDPKALQPRFRAWLEENQEPWTPVFNEWERIASDRFQGTAKGVMSAVRLRGEPRHLEATLEVPREGPWKGGLLLAHRDRRNYTVTLASSGKRIKVNRYENGRWKTLFSGALPPPKEAGRLRFTAEREGEEVVLTVEGTTVTRVVIPRPAFGLALDGCTLRFRDVRWETEGK